jgi:hypothetical protein
MVRAILNSKPNVFPAEPADASKPYKSEMRRVIKPQSDRWEGEKMYGTKKLKSGGERSVQLFPQCKVGDIL